MNANERDLLLRMADASERTDERVGHFGEALATSTEKQAAIQTDTQTIRAEMVGKTEVRAMAAAAFLLILLLILLLATSRGVDVGPAIEGAKTLVVPS